MSKRIREAWGMIETLLRDNPGMPGADLAQLLCAVLDATPPMIGEILGEMVAERFLIVDRSIANVHRYYLFSDRMAQRIVPAHEWTPVRSGHYVRSPIAWCVKQLQRAL